MDKSIFLGVLVVKHYKNVRSKGNRAIRKRKAGSSDKTEYRLSSGQTMKYDRDSGYLEEWNFKTLKWGTVSTVWSADSTGKANICAK